MKRNKVTGISIIIVILTLALSILYIKQASHSDDWKRRTTPLPKETIDLLCHDFELPSDDSLCDGNKDVYALDFVKVIRDTFRTYEAFGIESSEAATYDQVEEKIGTFKYECEPVTYQADGFSYFVCFYDLRGDREFIITVFYTYPEMAVMRLGITSRFDD
jgi:hypothetical protein